MVGIVVDLVYWVFEYVYDYDKVVVGCGVLCGYVGLFEWDFGLVVWY